MTRITVIGGTGYAGGNLVEALAASGHEVTSISRSLPEARIDGVEYVEGSALDDSVLDGAVADAEVVVSAISPRGRMAGRTRGAIAALASKAAASDVRLGIIGGAGSLLVAEGGPKVADTDGFPDEFKAEAAEMEAVLTDLQSGDAQLDWFYVSPAGGFGPWAPGEATGVYRIGGDVLLVDDSGESAISGADLGAAITAEIEQPAHRRARFTVAY